MAFAPASVLLAVLAHVCGLYADTEEGALRAAPPARFLSERATVWYGGTQMIAVEVDEPAVCESSLAVESSDPNVLAVVDEPVVLAGQTRAFVRVEGRALGEARLSSGSAQLQVTVRPSTASARARRARVRVTSPVQGAAVWGRVDIGVEVWHGVGGEPLAARLELPDGSLMAPAETLPAELGAWRRTVFSLDASELDAGSCKLVPLAFDAAETEGAALVRGDPLALTVVRPVPAELIAGECEATIEVERPPAFGAELPRLGASPAASAGGFVVNDRPDPAWLANVELERSGRYQMMVVARGDFAGGALPTIGLVTDDPNNAHTTARLVSPRWQRIPLGYPVHLEAGPQTIGVRYLNDAYLSPANDRNLYLDRFELVAVTEEDADVGGDLPGMSTMSIVSMVTRTRDASDDEELSGYSSGGVNVSFDRAFDGLPVNGRLVIEGWCRWDAPETNPPPFVELVLNGEVVSGQRAAEPVFALDRAALTTGANRVRLIATSVDGDFASTPVQTVHVHRDEGEPQGLARETLRFGVFDEGWDDGLRESLSGEGLEPGHRVAWWPAGAGGRLALPEELTGEYDVFVRARGPDGGATRRLRASLDRSGEVVELGEAAVRGGWNYHALGAVSLERGPKELALERPVEAAADADETGEPIDPKEDRLRLRAVFLRDKTAGQDRSAPRARVVYPAPGHVAYGADTVVVEAWDDQRLSSGDLLIDGRPQGTYGFLPKGAGHLVLPLLLRDVPAGEHRLQVRVVDEAGNVGESAELLFEVLAEPPPEPGQYARATRLLNRFAYGPDPGELAAVLTLGERAWLEQRLSARGVGDAVALGSAEARMRDAYNYFVGHATLSHAMRTQNAVRTRLVFWLENHFSTWMQKTQGPMEWSEHKQFLALGAAPFSELLLASATSPAMLHYLDQVQSYAGRLNENYAREIMELHTLGVDGGYSQTEVTELARLLTGLTLTNEALPNGQGGVLMRELRFDPALGDGAERDILGVRFEAAAPSDRFGRIQLALELLAAHPSTARHVSTKLAEHYVASPPPAGLVDDLSQLFLESGGDLAALLLAIAEHPSFWDEGLPPRVVSPLDFALRVARTSDMPAAVWSAQNYLNRSGMGIFDCATPDGYADEDAAWVDTNALLQRWRFVQDVSWAVRGLVDDRVRHQPAGDLERWHQRVVDLTAVRLTGSLLGAESNQAALDFMASLDGVGWEQVDRATVLVCRLPEAQLR